MSSADMISPFEPSPGPRWLDIPATKPHQPVLNDFELNSNKSGKLNSQTPHYKHCSNTSHQPRIKSQFYQISSICDPFHANDKENCPSFADDFISQEVEFGNVHHIDENTLSGSEKVQNDLLQKDISVLPSAQLQKNMVSSQDVQLFDSTQPSQTISDILDSPPLDLSGESNTSFNLYFTKNKSKYSKHSPENTDSIPSASVGESAMTTFLPSPTDKSDLNTMTIAGQDAEDIFRTHNASESKTKEVVNVKIPPSAIGQRLQELQHQSRIPVIVGMKRKASFETQVGNGLPSIGLYCT